MGIPKKCSEIQVKYLDGSEQSFSLFTPTKIDEYEDSYEFLTSEGGGVDNAESSMVVIQKSEVRCVRFVVG